MISIDHIAFDFVMNDEQFAKKLYADWDNFCHSCFESVMEECLSKYGDSVKDYNIENIDINIGRIQQEDFYVEFPKRLREEMGKALPLLNIPLVEKEEERYALRRLLLQPFSETFLIDIYGRAINMVGHTKDERLRLMEVFLEMRPDIPISYVHKSFDEESLHSMADLLDTYSIRSLMYKETEEHAEVGLASYWHSLYEWLSKYYPFDGLAIFGGKSNFIRHMNYRVLTFIHKRGENATYLSRVTLTKDFLVEVFGTAYYRQLLNYIYRLQPLKADGSPAYDSFEYVELYRVFMMLSLIDNNAENGSSDDIRIRAKGLVSSLQYMALEHPHEFVKAIRETKDDRDLYESSNAALPTEVLLHSMGRVNFSQTAILKNAIDRIRDNQRLHTVLAARDVSVDKALSLALVLFIHESDTLGVVGLTETEIIERFVKLLYKVGTRKTDIENDQEWLSIMGEAKGEQPKSESVMPEKEENRTEYPLSPIKLNDLDESKFKYPLCSIDNAGLCLLSPWFAILFARLGYLNESRKDFKNHTFRIRAVFLLQYLVYPYANTIAEHELAFCKLLTAIPQMKLLPRQMGLTEEERNTADDMIRGIKANWPQMKGTSVEGFIRSFIARDGTLREEEHFWLLTVGNEPQDLLLDTVPWSFKQIRLPWMRKYVQVRWNDKQEF